MGMTTVGSPKVAGRRLRPACRKIYSIWSTATCAPSTSSRRD